MHGLTVRWSLQAAPEGVEEALAAYVEATSHAHFTGMPGLRFKTWRMRPGEWFEGCYVFATSEAREEFQRSFTEGAAEAPAPAAGSSSRGSYVARSRHVRWPVEVGSTAAEVEQDLSSLFE